ncbi:MAG: hypothetical protein PF442_10740 [Desulfobulbaceae bacterium]|jgi:hypothetical protein|nr:hypothetical protein [Desulfobulbaceae bacterium]
MKERVDFVGHKYINATDLPEFVSPNNIIVPALTAGQKWLNETTEQIGDWRAKFRSAYIKWALCLNSIEKAIERYSDDDFKKNGKFWIDSFRVQKDKTMGRSKIALWNGDEVADNYQTIQPLIAENGIIEIYSAIEEYIFISYKIFLNHNPSSLLRGKQFRDLRKLYRTKNEDPELNKEWDIQWTERLNTWHRKKAYDGIKKVFSSYIQISKLSMGGMGELLNGVAESLDTVAHLRNLLVHNEPLVTEEFAKLTSQPWCPFPNIFQEGEKFAPDLSTLMGIEHMCDNMLTVINLSCVGLIKEEIY